MNDFLQMNVFFFVATIAVVLVTLLLCVALIYVLRILHRADKVTALVEEEARLVRGDVDELRTLIKTEGFKWKFIASSLRKTIRRFIGRTRK